MFYGVKLSHLHRTNHNEARAPMTRSRSPSTRVATLAARLLRVRWLVRAPIWLFRARLGFLTASRLLMLEHTGRRTGARHYVVLEVVSRPGPGQYVVASGFGQRAQWFRNIRANPSVRVFVGARGPRPAIAHILESDDARAALQQYARNHPRAWRNLRPVAESTLGAEIDEHGTTLPLVCLDTTTGRERSHGRNDERGRAPISRGQ
jgi:deazaflavin-dependent oxidoreductase (nitroreductase family)